MPDFRYHIFYLGLMFLMLGFGIFVGASVIGPAQVRAQTNSIANLRQQANKILQDGDQARDRLARDEGILAALRPGRVRGKLAGKRVIVLQTGDYPDAVTDATTAVSDAGATVVATVILTHEWKTLNARQRDALDAVAPVGADASAQDAALLAALAGALSDGTGAGPVPAKTLEALQGQDLITLTGDLSQPCGLFVVVGGGSDEADAPKTDGPLLAGFRASAPPARVVGCEPSAAASSSVPAFQAAGIASVDCVDLPLGQLDLPFALRGDMGDYGIKPTARQTLPEVLGGTPVP